MLNESLLQIKTTPSEYIELIQLADSEKRGYEEYADYVDFLPDYGISRCPYCGNMYSERLDSYTLRNWIINGAKGYYIFRGSKIKPCEHMVYTQAFISLHGVRPRISQTELRYSLDLTSEVPHVIGFLFTNDAESHAVIHSLPICRIEEDKFIPRYTLYIVTQYAQDRKPMVDRLHSYTSAHADDWRSLLAWPTSTDHDIWFDLNYWVKKGKLSWIEPENSDMKLVSGPVEDFPYGNIEGRTDPYDLSVPDYIRR
jgi:hypothetical protein